MAATGSVRIEGLAEFRSALRRAKGAYPRELTVALRKGGAPIQVRSGLTAPRRSGRLALGYRISASGSRGQITSTVPYAGGAEWGRRGKWSGFARYGSPPRTVGAALDATAPEVETIIYRELEEIMTAYGWFH